MIIITLVVLVNSLALTAKFYICAFRLTHFRYNAIVLKIRNKCMEYLSLQI